MTDIVQVDNLFKTKTRENPSRGRIYSIEGISPTLVCPSGGHSVPYIQIEEDDD